MKSGFVGSILDILGGDSLGKISVIDIGACVLSAASVAVIMLQVFKWLLYI